MLCFFRSCDRYLNSGANLLKLTEVVWLYLFLTISAFVVLSFIKIVTITYPRSIKSLLWDSINGKKLNKGSLEFYKDRFVHN